MKLLIKSFLILIVICLAIFLFSQITDLGGDSILKITVSEDDDRGNDDKRIGVIVIDGYKALRLDEESIVNSGVVSENVERLFYKQEALVYAEVVDITPLVDLKLEYENALAEQNIKVNDLNNHIKILQRAEALHKAKSLSTRDLDKSRADRDLRSSQLSAINTGLDSIKYKVKSLWGSELASYIFDKERHSDFYLLALNKD